MDGILLIDKPAGWTSHDVVAKIRSILRQAASDKLEVKRGAKRQVLGTLNLKLETPSPKVKVGHTGTLDPAATGLMVVVLGSYTKRAAEFSKLDKSYEAELTLGKTSTTGDSEGEITESDKLQVTSDKKKPSLDDIQGALKKFTGEIEQTPPAYSAIKINGQRAYKLARKGEKPALEPRKITIYEISVLDYEYPKLQIKTRVSSGTYIRSLADDIGKE